MHRKKYLLIPILLCAVWTYFATNYGIGDDWTIVITIAIYLITVAGFVYCIKEKPFNVWWLPVSFLLSPIPMYIYEYPGSRFLPFVGTGLVLMFYAIPFFIISVITAIVSSVSANK